MKRVFVAMSVAAFVFLGTSGDVSAQEGSGHDFVFLLDEFQVFGPGAGDPDFFDAFDDGDLGNWNCFWGTCQDEFGTSYARLESPGSVYHYPGWPSVERSDLMSWANWQFAVNADGWFQGVATFAAELPDTNESISLILHVLPFDRDDDGTLYNELIYVSIENPTLKIAALNRYTSVGLLVLQDRRTFDENWQLLSVSDQEFQQLTVPDVLGEVILSIRYDEVGHVFHAGYSLTESPEVLEPFAPIESNLHLSAGPGYWTIGARVDFLHADIDIKPGSDPNCFNLNGHGVIPVAINGSADLDVYDVDMDTLLFGGLQARVRGNKGPLCSIKDWNDDGFVDLVCHFEDDPGNWTGGDSTATLTGYLLDGTAFTGTDSICIVP